jgi:hypothetical protein
LNRSIANPGAVPARFRSAGTLRVIIASDLALASGAALVAFGVYLRTLLPDLGGPEDTPKFQYLGAVLGTAHEPGYPLYTLLSHAFSYVPVGSIAYRANLLSAVMGAAAVALATLVARAIRCTRAAAWLGALALAFGVAFWHYSVLAEVYTLSAALLLGVVLWLARWERSRSDRDLFAAAACFALALGNHLSIAAAAPAIALFLLVTDPRHVMSPRMFLPAALIVLSGFAQYVYILVRTRQGAPHVEAQARTLLELWEVVRARGYEDHVFAFGWKQVLAERLPGAARLVESELGIVGVLLAGLGLIALTTRKWRVAALIALSFAGIAWLSINLVGDVRGFLVLPLALASAFVATGADTLRALLTRLPGRAWAITTAVALVLYPAWLLRTNFAANDWRNRTEDARFFRAFWKSLPDRAAIVSENYMVDAMLTYLQAEGRDGPRVQVAVPPHPEAVRAAFESGAPVFAFDGRLGDLAPRGFHFEPVALARSDAPDSARRIYRLAGLLPAVQLGDGAWTDVTAAAHEGGLSLLVDNFRPFDARVTLYVSSDAPLRPMFSIRHRHGTGQPTIDVRHFDVDDEADRDTLRAAIIADAAPPDTVRRSPRYLTRVEHRVNDHGQYAAWAVTFGGVPRRVLGRAQLDRRQGMRALAAALPPLRYLAHAPQQDVSVGTQSESLFGDGWHVGERDGHGEFRWMAARDARLLLPLAHAAETRIALEVMTPSARQNQTSPVRVAVNGHDLGACDVPPGWHPCTWAVPAAVVAPGANEVVFSVPETVRPSDDGRSHDTRALGAAIRNLRLARSAAAVGGKEGTRKEEGGRRKTEQL